MVGPIDSTPSPRFDATDGFSPAPRPALSIDSRCPSAGQGRRDGDPLLTPIYQSTAFCCDRIESTTPHRYSRESNPTVAALEDVLGEFEDALPALCFASGLAAETALFLTAVRAGQHVVCSRAVYGGTTRLLSNVLAGLGVATTYVDTTDAARVAAAIRRDTALVFLETPSNPTLDITDLRAVSAVAHEAGALVVVDNTFLTPVQQRPLDLGCDVTVYSTTKFLEGHSAAMGGALVMRDEGLRERLFFTRKCTGGIQTPMNAWLTLQGLKTLALRIRRQADSAAKIASWLAGRSDVARVNHPSLPSFRFHERAVAQHLGSHGGVVSFELAGGADAARGLLANVRIPRLVEHVGATETLLTHSATMTHAAVPREDRLAVGVTDGLLRLSVGIEDPVDLIADLEQAIEGAGTNGGRSRAEGDVRLGRGASSGAVN
jgi:cystathionine beta-lyase/cystathionine gamma-synthase